jgi:hypothetical protein
MLFFKREFLSLIKAGTKRQTIRFWKSPRVHAGQRAFVPGLGYIKIRAIKILPSLNALTAADARADGFKTRRALLAALHQLYGTLPPDRRIFRITFTWPAPHTKPPAAKPHRTRTSSRARRQLLKNFVLKHAPSPRVPSASRR